jgi:hypothetical protein
MAKLWQRSRDPKTKSPVVEIAPNHLKITSPTVIFLPGIFTTDGKPAHIAESLDEVEALLRHPAAQKVKPKLYALSHKALCGFFNLAAYNARPQDTCSREARKAAKELLLPLVLKDGKPLPRAEAEANLRNLTLVAYSAGSVFAQELYNGTLQGMKKADYAEEDARKLLQEVVLISLATVSRPAEEGSRFTTLYLAAANDLAVRAKNRLWKPVKELFALDTRDLKIQELSSTSLFITAYIPKELWHQPEDETGAQRRHEIAPLLPDRGGLRSRHEMPHYTTSDDGHNAFARIVLNGLVNALNRKTKLTPAELLQPATARTPQQAEAYLERLERARHAPARAFAKSARKKEAKRKETPGTKPEKLKNRPPRKAA